MTEILRQKIIKLVRGDDGVALVVTLALFMFLYVSCAGVYTVGRAVKDRIILQNAVDAAAYSAAVVQADYLSRIATINRAMAWTYKTLVRSQKGWIGFKTIKESREKYKTDRDDKSDGTIAATIPGANNRTIGIRGEGVPKPIIDETEFEDWSKDEIDEKLEEYEDVIRKYSGVLDEMIGAINELQGRFYDEGPKDERITTKVEEVLRANLPARLGELCRYQLKLPMRDDGILMSMSSDKESVFLQFAGEDNIADFREKDWFPLLPGESFTRSFERLQTYWTYLERNTHVPVIRDPTMFNDGGVDAERDFKAVFSGAFSEVSANPLILSNNYFLIEGKPANGAITVAIAKFNENPWMGLVRDIAGFYAAFTHVVKNDWTIVIASAQAGYHPEDGKDREYSLDGKAFEGEGQKAGKNLNLCETDWDAVYLPVRMAFGSKGDGFSTWIRGGSWGKLVPDRDRKYVLEPLEEIDFDELNHEALPRMHNNYGRDCVLKWNSDGIHAFLDLMYH